MGIMSGLSDEAEKQVLALIKQEEHFTPKEREFVHTASKYIESKQLPLLGQMLELANDSAKQLGIMVIKLLFFMGLGGLVLGIVAKIKGWI